MAFARCGLVLSVHDLRLAILRQEGSRRRGEGASLLVLAGAQLEGQND
jgi:hypothetical protein